MSGAADAAWEARGRDLVSQFVALLDSRFDLLTSRHDPSLLARQLAAGALARCRALLDAMELLADDRPDVMGLLLRNLWETSTTALYILKCGPQALERAGAEHLRNVGIIVDRNQLDPALRPATRGKARDAPTIEEMSRAVQNKLRDPGTDTTYATVGYDRLYRSESTFGGHGVGAMQPYMSAEADPWTVLVKPGPINVDSAAAYLQLGAMHAGVLAYHVFVSFGVGTTDLERVRGEIDATATEPRRRHKTPARDPNRDG